MKMEDRWINKGVDLSVLINHLIQFFEKRKFVTSLESSEEEYHIIVAPTQHHDILETIHIYIGGRPDDFKVRFDAGSLSRALVRRGILTTFLGGGILTLKGLKSQEALEKLEREFWNYLDRVIWSLANSASSKC